MSGSKTQTWVIGTVIIAVLVLIGTWFLAVSPKLTEAYDTRATTQQELTSQTTLRAQLAKLKSQFAQIDTYKGSLAALQVQIPTKAGLPGYLRELDALAIAKGVTLMSVTPGKPDLLTPQATKPVATATPATTGQTATGMPAAQATASTDAPPVVRIPVSMTVVGTYAAAKAFLDGLQVGTSRLYLVTSLNTTTQAAAPASSGRPATSPGDVEMTIDGSLYALPELATSAAPGSGTPAPTPPPLPASARNPFAPVAGH